MGRGIRKWAEQLVAQRVSTIANTQGGGSDDLRAKLQLPSRQSLRFRAQQPADDVGEVSNTNGRSDAIMVLFLNFDGVLHPNAVQFEQKDTPVLDAPGHRLFESSKALAEVAGHFTDLRLILNTWWTYRVGFDACLRRLPKALASRVAGSILPHASLCPTLPHRISLASDAADHSDVPILILDHADARYPKHLLHITFLLEPQVGLAAPQAARAFRQFISRAASRVHREPVSASTGHNFYTNSY
jgi:HAD domain in Swiss Army Knife RNA repair proteins